LKIPFVFDHFMRVFLKETHLFEEGKVNCHLQHLVLEAFAAS